MATSTEDRDQLQRHRDEFARYGELLPETRLLDAIFAYGVTRNGVLYEERYSYQHPGPAEFLFRRYVGRVRS